MRSCSTVPSRVWFGARLAVSLAGFGLGWTTFAAAGKVDLVRTPNDGIQPQALIDARGAVHLIYFKGDPQGGNVFYVRQEQGKESFSAPMRVNTQDGCAVAVGTIRGAQLALGRNGLVHVAWNGNHASGKHRGPPMFYTRLNDARTGFELERDLITHAAGLDGGGSVAADDQGNVYVVWHAPTSDADEGEAMRAVFVARSNDDGRTFSRETQAIPRATGACGCCGLRAFVDHRGDVLVLFRAATDKVSRDEILMASRDRGASFEIINSDPWNISTCPMSSAWLSEGRTAVLAVWETNAKVFLAQVNPETLKVAPPVSPATKAQCKHAVAASNTRGETLLAWAEGTGWQRGGAVAWELFDSAGHPLAKGRENGVPAWGLVAVIARPSGDFTVFY